ncbi:ketosteroid isomerase [Actinosynnema sp. ALI-1.44]|nr:ketosteroid isomerase [Actinosynnema sp. ALI-1.44]
MIETDLRSRQVRHYYELVDLADFDSLVRLFAPDAVYHRPGFDPIVGHDGLTRFFTAQRQIREGAHVVESIVDAGDQVAVRGVFAGTLKNGTEVTARFADFFKFAADGRFERRYTYFYAPLV